METKAPSADFASYLETTGRQIDSWLDQALPAAGEEPANLHEAMRYAVFPGGKRLRPVLAVLACEAFGGKPEDARAAACALELIHCYSLVHDDLPSMDDDDLRRGKPSCHKAYGEATAVLVGDGLQALAFELLANDSNAAAVPRLVKSLAEASGSRGMVGGQELDLLGTGSGKPTTDQVRAIHLRKTAALIAAAFEMGAACTGAGNLAKVRDFGRHVGLAFQITDDILDATSDAVTLGKTPGKDLKDGKLTWPAAVGLETARRDARDLASRAEKLAAELGARYPERLGVVPRFVVERFS